MAAKAFADLIRDPAHKIIVLDRRSGTCAVCRIPTIRRGKEMTGRTWLHDLLPGELPRLLDWLATDDCGPFAFLTHPVHDCPDMRAVVEVSLVRENFGVYAVCVGTSVVLPAEPQLH